MKTTDAINEEKIKQFNTPSSAVELMKKENI